MKYRRFLALILIVVVSAGLATLSEAFGGLTGVEQLENRLLDTRQQTTAESFQSGVGERASESDVVMVLFDDYTVMDEFDGWAWYSPASRAHIAEVIDALAGAGARTIGLDVFLDKLYHPRLKAIDDGDDLLQAAIERAGNVVLVTPIQVTDSGPVSFSPHPYFADVAADIGTAEVPTAFETFRSGTLAARSADTLEPSFALAMYAHYKGFDVDSLLLETRKWGRVPIPGMPDNVGSVPGEWFEEDAASESNVIPFRIRYVGPPSSSVEGGPPGTFQAFGSFFVPLTAPFLPEAFEDKVVLIGTGWHNEDKFRTPFYDFEYSPLPDTTATVAEGSAAVTAPEPYGWMYGVEIHANSLQNMLDEEYVTPLSDTKKILLLLFVALLTGGITFWQGAGWGGATTIFAVLGLMIYAFWAWAGIAYGPGGTYFAFEERFAWVPIVLPALSAIFSYVSSSAYVAVIEGKERRFIQGAFGKYVSPDVVADLANNPGQLQLGGQKRDLSILFSDLAGFTTLSERMDPADLLAHLNEYLTEMTQVVMDEQGTLDKYIGDAIMAFWNAPRDVPDHADKALRTMILSQRKMGELNRRWAANDPDHEELVVRIGVNTGEVVVGNVGGENRFDYSAIGDAVNLAARLEPANKSYDTLNMCSQFTLDAADTNAFRIRELDLIAVKGKKKPVQVYEVLELTGVALPDAKEKAVAAYDLGMTAYKKHDWTSARDQFLAGLAACPDDGPCRVYAERCAAHLEDPPPADWDFVVRRMTK